MNTDITKMSASAAWDILSLFGIPTSSIQELWNAHCERKLAESRDILFDEITQGNFNNIANDDKISLIHRYTLAAMNGAAFLCYVTPAEHLALPNVEDVKQGIIASKIAAHAADIAKGVPGARDIDDKMAEARQKLDWDAQYACALDPETAKAIRDSRSPEEDHSDTCSMCGKFCAVRSMNKALAGEYIDIL